MRLPWIVWAIATPLAVAATVAATVIDYTGASDLPFAAGFALLGVGAATTGAVVASRLPGNAVGWILLALGLGLAVMMASGSYAEISRLTEHGPLPADDVAAWIGAWSAIPVMFGLPLYLLLLFPDGRFLSERWRRVSWALAAIVALATLATALQPRFYEPDILNPFAATGDAAAAVDVLVTVTDHLALPGFVVAVAALVVRLRRARVVERQQLKWFSYTAVFAGLGLTSAVLAPPPAADLAFGLGLLALAAMPISTGVAILRYRLYDIDVVINRTLVYGALTGTLALAYLGSVLLAGLAVGDSNLTVAVSTLAVAALFRPARARIQAIVDRRFYRRRYDAQRTLESFAARVRDEVDLDALSGELRAVVGESMQPAHVSLWLSRTGP